MSKDTYTTNAWVYDPIHDVIIVEGGVAVMVNSNVELSSVEYSGPGVLVQVPTGTVWAGYIYDPVAGTFTAPPPPPVDRSSSAKTALAKSDITVLRCIEHGITVPTEWVDYRAALRPIAGSVTPYATLPTRPSYPTGS